MIYLMRHGADPFDRLGGWSAWGSTEEGRQQVFSAANYLHDKGITKIYASDLNRAKETAQIAANALSPPVIYLPAFREVNNGLLAGMRKTEAAQKFPEIFGEHAGLGAGISAGRTPGTVFQPRSRRMVCVQRTNRP